MCGSVHHTMMASLFILFFNLKAYFLYCFHKIVYFLKKGKGISYHYLGEKKLGDMKHKTSIMRMALKNTMHYYFRSCDF